ncbi:Pycsar system effector family protein [Streptomyces sp. NBC_01451]|uniref:Pycsar system effector family protein n=1 Tax=Streptomyces sp. NBC_01451 TaxID=2903872 RepID=UPI002E377112|nr:Pycsar system effector family protein [Streptomyces sp. NBC_01451]
MAQTDPAAADSRPIQRMFTALHTTHQHADAKAGILAAVQAALVGTAGTWSRQAVRAWEQGGATGALTGTLLILFVCGLIGGAGSLAAALRPRIQRDPAPNRYSFAHLARGADIVPAVGTHSDEAAERMELSRTVRFLARVALLKYRCLTGAVMCTAVMGLSAGLSIVLHPVLA